MRRSRVQKPCPGCQTTDYTRPSADQVCYNCADMIKEGRAAVNRAKRKKDVELVMLPFAPHRLKKIPHLFYGGPDDDLEMTIQRAFFELAELLGGGEIDASLSKSEPFAPPVRDGFGSHEKYFRVPAGLRQIVCALYENIIKAVERAREEGYGDGHRLIIGLATGEVSIETLNNATVGEKLIRKGRRAMKRRK